MVSIDFRNRDFQHDLLFTHDFHLIDDPGLCQRQRVNHTPSFGSRFLGFEGFINICEVKFSSDGDGILCSGQTWADATCSDEDLQSTGTLIALMKLR